MSDLDRLVQVLAVARSSKLQLTAIAVGDIRLVFGAPMGGEQPAAKPSSPDELASMRKRARQLFGRDVPDDQLKELFGAI